jgi:hypothetical protein
MKPRRTLNICKFTTFRLHPDKSKTLADNTGRYGALSRTLADTIARNRGRYRTLWGPFADTIGRYLAASMTQRCGNIQICKNSQIISKSTKIVHVLCLGINLCLKFCQKSQILSYPSEFDNKDAQPKGSEAEPCKRGRNCTDYCRTLRKHRKSRTTRGFTYDS